MTAAVEHALANTSEVKGQRFTVNGADNSTLNQILHLAEKQLGKDEGSTKLTKSLPGLNISDFVEEFFTGITHDKNMARLA